MTWTNLMQHINALDMGCPSLEYNARSLLQNAIAPLIAACAMAVGAALYVLLSETPQPGVYFSLLGAILLCIVWGALVAWKDLCRPLIHMREWVLNIRAGDLASRLDNQGSPAFGGLAQDLNDISSMLQTQSENNERQIAAHLKHIEQKQDSLKILYDVAASVNSARDVNDLLVGFLHTLKDLAHAKAASVRLLTNENKMKLVAATGMDAALIERETLIPEEACACHRVVVSNRILSIRSLNHCKQVTRSEFFNESNHLAMIAVPLQYRDTVLGVYNLFVDQDNATLTEDTSKLFLSIGRHLGVAIEKARLDKESGRLILMEERTRMAHELHDSLAQTLVSMRFQVRVLDETLHQDDERSAWATLEVLENTLDEANTELRELISRFRAPMSKRGLVPSVEQAVERFRAECDIAIFLQNEWPDTNLPPNKELQVLRIIQEALANIRKHSKANAVRVLMRGDLQGNRDVMIEDDGIGMPVNPDSRRSHNGEHIGLKILNDRARQLGGTLRFESEPGEGTRIELHFKLENPKPDYIINPFSIENLHEPQSTRH